MADPARRTWETQVSEPTRARNNKRGTVELMLLQATLNGGLTKADHGAVPVTVEELVVDAAECVAVGARAFHVHPRDERGRESLRAGVVDRVVTAVRDPHGLPVGVTTGEWIEPDLRHRLRLIREWTQPDYTSVNLSEPGAVEVMQALLEAGIGIEAGVCTVEDTERLVRCGLSGRVTRVMIEPVEATTVDAVPLVAAIHAVLDRAEVGAPRLQHGDGEATWILIEDAIRRGIDTRVGFEDTLVLPDGQRAASNADLVRVAYEIGAGRT
jgi:uncharacterized protein (DUF849 family)